MVESFYPKSNEWKYSDLAGEKERPFLCCTCCRLLGISLNKTAVKITKRHLNHKKHIVLCWGRKVQLKRILSGLYCDGSLKKKLHPLAHQQLLRNGQLINKETYIDIIFYGWY